MRTLKVFVYKNLTKSCFSVRSVETGKVIAHVASLQLRNARFKVSEAGRKRVLKEGRKNVHAGVEGELLIDPNDFLPDEKFPVCVFYNPYNSPACFYNNKCLRVDEAEQVLFKDGKVFCG